MGGGLGCAHDGDGVAGGVLYFVHHGVGGAEDGGDGVCVVGEDGQAEAAGDVEGETLRGEEGAGAESLVEGVGEGGGGGLFSVGDEDDELVATIAEG